MELGRGAVGVRVGDHAVLWSLRSVALRLVPSLWAGGYRPVYGGGYGYRPVYGGYGYRGYGGYGYRGARAVPVTIPVMRRRAWG